MRLCGAVLPRVLMVTRRCPTALLSLQCYSSALCCISEELSGEGRFVLEHFSSVLTTKSHLGVLFKICASLCSEVDQTSV